jgi:aldehyde:ferredoxin oxidoreductase
MDEQDLADLYRCCTGFEMDGEIAMEAGRRIITMERIYNAALGVTRKDDILPYRLMHEKQSGALHDHAINSEEILDRMKNDYYRLHHWDLETGLPTPETLAKLGLGDLARKIPRTRDIG